jgi:hypothetical protein
MPGKTIHTFWYSEKNNQRSIQVRTADRDHIYRITAGDPAEEDAEKIFLSQDKTFEEADTLFTSLLGKKEYPVIMLDEGDITIRGFSAPDKDEWNERYTILKEDMYRKSNPDKEPLYIILAYENNYPDTWYSGYMKKAYNLLESDNFSTAFGTYMEYIYRYSDGKTPYTGMELIDRNSRRTIERHVLAQKKPEKSIKPNKKPEEPEYGRS